jgi:hypothetical protein
MKILDVAQLDGFNMCRQIEHDRPISRSSGQAAELIVNRVGKGKVLCRSGFWFFVG